MRYFFSLWFTLFLFSCQPSDNTNTTKPITPFFNLKNYIHQEVQRLDGIGVQKIVILDGVKDTTTMQQIDMSIALELFQLADINRPSWYDKYSVDTTIVDIGKQLKTITYTTTNEDLPTKLLAVSMEQNAVKKIEILYENNSFIRNTKQHLIYIPDIGYNIESEQKVIANPKQVATINVEWIGKG